jgi:N-acetylmuramoyl-L-alanine amidase
MIRIHHSPSPNFDERAGGQTPSMIIIHYTGTKTAEEARNIFCSATPCDEYGRLSPHYLIDGAGDVFALVEEDKRAWHAGRSSWRDITDINSASIGIEIWNTGHEHDFENFLPIQIENLIGLIQDIRSRWDIPNQNILGHSDVAPGRKIDPGEKFPWGKLADANIGFMPRQTLQDFDISEILDEPRQQDFFNQLQSYGYTYTDDQEILLREFRRHFLPQYISNPHLTTADEKILQYLIELVE